MEKSGIIVGGFLGATVVLIVFTFLMIPPATILPPEIIVSNGHPATTVGEQTPILTNKDLSLTEIFERSEAGVVRVNVIKSEQIAGLNGVGSGFVFDQSGHVITNHHVIDNSEKIVVTFLDGSSYNANIVGSDPFTDIAVIKVDAEP